MATEIHTFIKTGRIRRASYDDVCNWILHVWNQVKPQCIQNGFNKAKLHTYVYIFEEWNYESDEEFDGFH